MSAAAAKHDPTSAFVREVIALYHEAALAEARFPDLDLEVLLAAERALQETQLELERCEAQLAAARAALVEQLEAIESKAERALAYARVYATGDLELTARLADLGRKKPAADGERAPPRKRGRPKKAADGAELFAVDGLAADGGGEPEQPVAAPAAEPKLANGHAKRVRERESLSL